MNLTMWGREFELSTTLRVAYEVQGQHNHKPYAEVFKDMGEAPVEDQIGVIYAAFLCANREYAKDQGITRKVFTEVYMDTYNLKALMDHLKELIDGIFGGIEEGEEEQKEEGTSEKSEDESPKDLSSEPGTTSSEWDPNVDFLPQTY